DGARGRSRIVLVHELELAAVDAAGGVDLLHGQARGGDHGAASALAEGPGDADVVVVATTARRQRQAQDGGCQPVSEQIATVRRGRVRPRQVSVRERVVWPANLREGRRVPQAKRAVRVGDARRWQKGAPTIMCSATMAAGARVKTALILAGTSVVVLASATSLAAQKPARRTPTLVGTPGASAAPQSGQATGTQPGAAPATAKAPRPTPTLQGSPGTPAPAAAATPAAGATVQAQSAHSAPA